MSSPGPSSRRPPGQLAQELTQLQRLRQEARALGLKSYGDGIPCHESNGKHTGPRRTTDRRCLVCLEVATTKRRESEALQAALRTKSRAARKARALARREAQRLAEGHERFRVAMGFSPSNPRPDRPYHRATAGAPQGPS